MQNTQFSTFQSFSFKHTNSLMKILICLCCIRAVFKHNVSTIRLLSLSIESMPFSIVFSPSTQCSVRCLPVSKVGREKLFQILSALEVCVCPFMIEKCHQRVAIHPGTVFSNILALAVVQSPSHVQFFVTPWTAAYLAPLSTGFSWQEYWSRLHFLLQGIPNKF